MARLTREQVEQVGQHIAPEGLSDKTCVIQWCRRYKLLACAKGDRFNSKVSSNAPSHGNRTHQRSFPRPAVTWEPRGWRSTSTYILVHHRDRN